VTSDYVTHKSNFGATRNTTIQRIGQNRKKLKMLRVVYMLFYFYIVQAILQKNLFCVKMQETVTTHDTMRMGAVSSRSAKFNTTPIPTEPMTQKLWVYLHLCRTLRMVCMTRAVTYGACATRCTTTAQATGMTHGVRDEGCNTQCMRRGAQPRHGRGV